MFLQPHTAAQVPPDEYGGGGGECVMNVYKREIIMVCQRIVCVKT